MVAVPVALALVVPSAGETRVAVRVKVSPESSSLSTTRGVRTSTPVWLGAKVAVVASAQVFPPSLETCRSPAPPAATP